MIKLFSRPLVVAALVALTRGQDPAPAAASGAGAATTPRLVVLCSVDQLASWVFEEAQPHFTTEGGFQRLVRDGVTFTNCAYEHACTETGPGHATIGTGAPARLHGIVRNSWYSAEVGKTVYCVGVAAEALPELPEGRNRGPGRLLAPTLSQTMRQQLAGCRTASVSWKDRSAILMVGAEADVAAWIETSTGHLVTNRTWCREVPPWIARFNADRVLDGLFGSVWQPIGPESAYAGLVDDRPYEQAHGNGTGAHTLPQKITGGTDAAGKKFYAELYASPFGNEVVRRAAEACIDGMQLGADEVPDLLAVSFSSTDLVGHYFGPDSVEARDTLLRLDRELERFLAFLDQKVGAGRYAFFLTADHGVGPTPEWAKSRGIDAGRGLLQSQARAAAERDLVARFGPAPAGHRYCTHVGEWALVLDRAAFTGDDAEARFAEATRIAAAAATHVAGIEAAYPTTEILEQDPGDDPIRRSLRAALHPERAGDVQLVAKPYWLDGPTPASHGTPHPYDREVVAFAMGTGLPTGTRISEPVTPGIGVVLFARLLGISPPASAQDRLPAALLQDKQDR